MIGSPGGHWHLGEITHDGRLAQADETGECALQEIHLAHQNVARLRAWRYFAHEVRVALVLLLGQLRAAGLPGHRVAAGALDHVLCDHGQILFGPQIFGI